MEGESTMIGPGEVGLPFDRETILNNVPDQSGVYAIYNESNFIYIGEGQDIRARLLGNSNGDNSCVLAYSPAAFLFELVDAHERVARWEVLMAQLNPSCN
jgi:hypothetical protein